ncbi:MAG: hypothetical protein M3Y79_04605, partial [Pseudomonadota bacterium]|nr:hypothetical protein [Pseudomonadota bacterium]
MTSLTLILAVLALVLLGALLFVLLRANPLQSRLEELLEERSRLNASLEHARQSLESEQGRARDTLAAQEERSRQAQLTAEERFRDALSKEQQRVQQQLAEQKQWITDQTRHFETSVLAAAARLMEERGKA